MPRSLISLLLFLTVSGWTLAQTQPDTVRVLDTVTVRAYASDRTIMEVPAAIGLIKPENLNRFSNTSFVSVFNTVPGVRMEERSPGSYRFSIRGSSLRSPFGVRNVKFYWNGLPLTDGGGNTYLNLLDFSALGRAEIIKGPAGSLYGAGTGGAVLMNNPVAGESLLQVGFQGGNYGLRRYTAQVQTKSDGVITGFRYAHQDANGYRQQSGMRRDAANADMTFLLDPSNSISTNIFYTDLYYQTPGGLTQAQYDTDPSQARPATATVPGAVEQQAAVFNKTFYGGINYDHDWNDKWSSRIGVLGSTIDFKNSAILNYENRTERNVGVRSENQFKFTNAGREGKITFGVEYQYFTSKIYVTNNNQGTPGNLVISDDDVTSSLGLGFAQAELDLPNHFYLTLGGSLNFLKYEDTALATSPEQTRDRKFSPEISPRIALLRKFGDHIAAYLSASKGFSPPTVAEVIPSSGVYNPDLNPEVGWSYEGGMRGNFFNEKFTFNVALYDLELNETIVNQPINGQDYFVNAGTTSQKGAEIMLNWSQFFRSRYIHGIKLWTSHSYNHYRFQNYINRGNDYSGNALTGVPPSVFAFGADVTLRSGFYLNLTGNYTDRLPLNDANTDYATEYFLFGWRVGGSIYFFSVPLDFFVGVDNALNQRYSLGNDLNAAGARYYNAAPLFNGYAGIGTRLFKSQIK